jgi:hypothetical protein
MFDNETYSSTVSRHEWKDDTINVDGNTQDIYTPDINIKHRIQTHAETHPNDVNAGALTALVMKGPQDVYFNHESAFADYFNKKKDLLHKGKYQSVYGKIGEIKFDQEKKGHKFSITLDRTCCDLIDKLDIVLKNPNKLSINDIIVHYESEIGGQRIDRVGGGIDCDVIDTWIKTNYELFYKKKKDNFQVGNKIFIPLFLAPFYEHNMMPLVALKHHEVKINVWMKEGFLTESTNDGIEIWGYKYYLDTEPRTRIKQMPHEMCTIQNQYTGSETMKYGINKFRLNFNHPVHTIYFWGFDKNKVRNVTLTLNGIKFFEGSIEVLEHLKYNKGYSFEPVAIFFSQDDFKDRCGGTINFSRIDNAQLIIETDEEIDTEIQIVALNFQILRIMSGMAGLAYSK